MKHLRLRVQLLPAPGYLSALDAMQAIVDSICVVACEQPTAEMPAEDITEDYDLVTCPRCRVNAASICIGGGEV